MMHRTAILALFALTLVACGDDDSGPPVIVIDAGGDMNMAMVDMGPPAVDMGSTRSCGARQPTLPASLLPRCSAATATCLAACTTQACATACLDGDTTAAGTYMGQAIDCATCTNAQAIGCAAASTCGNEFDAVICCGVDNCASMLNAACLMGPCAAAVTAFSTCANAADCAADVDMCFATADVDAGTPDVDAGPVVDAGPAVDGGAP